MIEQVAWAVGLFEGEGTVGTQRLADLAIIEGRG